MKYLYTIQKTINAICKKYPKGALIQARIGMRTNGDLHIGNLFPIISSVIIGKRLIEKGFKFKLIIVFVDQEINGNNLPFNYLNFSKNKTLAQYSIDKIKSFIGGLVSNDVNFVFEYRIVSKTQKTRIFRKMLIKILNNSKRVIPIYTLCKKCNGLLKGYKKKEAVLIYNCRQCNANFELSLEDLKAELLLDHDLLGAIENNFFKIDLHILGSDHEISKKGSTSMEKRSGYQKILNHKVDYLTMLAPLVLFKNKKMSKSKKRGIFLDEIKACFPKDCQERLINFVWKNNAKSEIDIKSVYDVQ